ncbi:MAG: L,D-transpeptidase [Mucilaginibacter sp.]|nr:L,D-transpeptidase [Mucilaginibacter sp.]
MMIFRSAKRSALTILFFLPFIFLTLQGCKKKRPEMATILYKKTHNKVFNNVTPEGFSEVFKHVLDSAKSTLAYPRQIAAFYEQNDYDAQLVMDHLFNSDLNTAAAWFMKADEHGLNPKMFRTDEIRALLKKFDDKKGIKTVNEAYHDMAELELLFANSLIKYSTALQYGIVNPKKIYVRYYTDAKLPDTATMMQVLQTRSIKNYLDSIQPKTPQYVALQKALTNNYQAPGLSPEETKRTIIANLERLRWKNKPSENKYVIVNIPDYTLNVVENGHPVLNMKVCDGEGRNKTNANTIVNYHDTATVDRPFPRETPQLNSLIHSVDVNPVWNIPESIASKEIMVDAAKDRYYLSNKGIQVYKNGKLVDDQDIDWSTAKKDEYEFKQKPGDDNSLGKIKFLFTNKSNVYLHDTPAKSAFDLPARDVSHGCVRLGEPQQLALNLFGPGPKYNLIVKDMASDRPDPTTIYLPKKVPVYITYVTCWADESGTLQFRQDVYGLDIVLYANLLKAGI